MKEITWGSKEDDTKEKYWEDTNAQHLLRSIVRLNVGHPYFEPGDVKDDLKECEQHSMTKKDIRKLLDGFVDDFLVKKTQNHAEGSSQYQVAMNMKWICKFMNPRKGEVPDEDDLLYSSEDESSLSNLESDSFCSEEEVAIAEVISSPSNTSDVVSTEYERTVSPKSPSAAINSERNGSASAAISPEELGDGLAEKRKAAVYESATSKKSKKEMPNPEEEKGSLLEEFCYSAEV